ncbi:MAG: DNA mismatch repair protein MutS [Candidatus Omnitrophica bacterium]|nr:DNA mismatch repair protein MutS [Candidatus Omnitrophota bacterium]MBU4479568.1 DNA mismatch repair protein MutS [Candidatus Omnitrophota bacterium]
MQKVNDDLTPMMNQYLQIKRDYRDAILFFRLGDFYEMFFDDAKLASSILGLTLTGRGAGKNNRVPMCGIPYHASENYISRLISAGQKVAICEQTEDPKLAKGIVKREIVRMITPGTLVGQSILSRPHNNYLAGVFQRAPQEFGLAAADLSTGEFLIAELNNEEKLIAELTRLAPAELLLCAAIKSNAGLLAKIRQKTDAPVSEVEEWTFDFTQGYDKLTAHFKTKNLRGFGCEEMSLAVSAAGAVLRYLEGTQKTDLAHIKKITPYSLNKVMVIDSIAQRTLELVRSIRGDKKATLLQELDFTQTAMASRLIVRWIQQPLLDIPEINRRLDAVEELYKDQLLRSQFRDVLKEIVDIERLLGRISLGAGNGRDLFSLKQSLKKVPELIQKLSAVKSGLLTQIRQGMSEHRELVELLDKGVRDDAPLSVREGRMIKPGFNAELDELLKITQGGKEWLARLQQQEIERTGISSLKVKFNKVFGYYIEVSNSNLHLIPPDYTRKQTLVNAERFITPGLKEQEEKILCAEEKLVDLEYRLFMDLCRQVSEQAASIQQTAFCIAVLDVLNSLAEAAARNKYTRPHLREDSSLKIIDGRHPVLENLLSRGKFIPNDTRLDCEENQVLIITGPNMAGKSTYIRQVALLVLMAQMGSFVPAKEAHVGIVDRIFTRVGAADDISAGMSTFMMEMSETANILNNATSRSIIILDEIGRGTSTFDGLSIAWATAEYLHAGNGAKPKTLFATHYHELAEMEMLFKGIKNYNVAVREWNDEVVFLYKLIPGSADHSYGIHVARLAGLPREVIARAREILSNLEINSMSHEGIPSLVKSNKKDSANQEKQGELFQAKENPIIAEIRSLEVNHLSPLEALNMISGWKERLRKEHE